MSEAAQAGPGTRELDRAPHPHSSVPCPLKQGAQIGMGRCVEWQRDNGCHCEHALVALRSVEAHLLDNPQQESVDDAQRRAEDLDGVRGLIARATEIEKVRPAPEPELSRVEQIVERLRKNRERYVARKALPAPPAKERVVGRISKLDSVTDEELRKAYAAAPSILALREQLGCGYLPLRKRIAALGLPGRAQGERHTNGAAAPSPKPRANHAKPPPVAPPDATHSDPGQSADEFERMRRILEDYHALSRAGRLYVSGRLSSLSGE